MSPQPTEELGPLERLQRFMQRHLPMGEAARPTEEQEFVGHVHTCDLDRSRLTVEVQRGHLERGQEVRLRGPGADAEIHVQAVLLAGREVRTAGEGDMVTVLGYGVAQRGQEPVREGAKVFVKHDVYRRKGAAALERFPVRKPAPAEPPVFPPAGMPYLALA